MAIRIAFASLKGGVGKSTLTLNVATCLHQAGHRVLIVDADPQGTCSTWAAKAAELEHDGPPVVAMTGAALRRDLVRVADGYDVVVLDSPPRVGTEARAVMLAADLVVLPVTPGAADVWAARETVTVFDDAHDLRPELRGVVVLNRADRTALSRMAGKAVEGLGVDALDVVVGQRVAFGEATLAGQGVVTYAPSSDAAREVRRLTRALLDVFGPSAGEVAA
jgi:chromosome partitioning protein